MTLSPQKKRRGLVEHSPYDDGPSVCKGILSKTDSLFARKLQRTEKFQWKNPAYDDGQRGLTDSYEQHPAYVENRKKKPALEVKKKLVFVENTTF